MRLGSSQGRGREIQIFAAIHHVHHIVLDSSYQHEKRSVLKPSHIYTTQATKTPSQLRFGSAMPDEYNLIISTPLCQP
jgi:hypothetical protein